MKDISHRVFRHMGRARLIMGDGSVQEGRGAVVRWKGSTGDPLGALHHRMGDLDEPLYVFTGSLPAVGPGDLLEQGGERYTVLHGSRMLIGDTVVCSRAVLEKRGDDDAGL